MKIFLLFNCHKLDRWAASTLHRWAHINLHHRREWSVKFKRSLQQNPALFVGERYKIQKCASKYYRKHSERCKISNNSIKPYILLKWLKAVHYLNFIDKLNKLKLLLFFITDLQYESVKVKAQSFYFHVHVLTFQPSFILVYNTLSSLYTGAYSYTLCSPL